MKYWAKHPKQRDAYSKGRMEALSDFVLFEAQQSIEEITGRYYPYNDWARDMEKQRHRPISELVY
jgi:hypothetical protein